MLIVQFKGFIEPDECGIVPPPFTALAFKVAICNFFSSNDLKDFCVFIRYNFLMLRI